MSEIAATCFGVNVPNNPYLNERRIERLNKGRYEGQEINGALTLVEEGDRVVELGAGMGIVGAVIAKNRRPARMISFEANPELIPHIRNVYAENALEGTIEVRNEVLVTAPDAPETMEFHIQKSYLGSSLYENSRKTRTSVAIPTRQYAEIRDELNPTILIVDIEGGELAFLRGANLNGIRAIVIEFHPDVYEKAGMRECKRILRDAGFEPVPELSSRTVWAATRAEMT